jgi:DNA-binding NarL/FixJ family response regulator
MVPRGFASQHDRVTSVLIVDDHAAIRTGLRVLLEGRLGIERITAVADGEQALASARREPPDVAVVDYHLPREDGLRLSLRLEEAAPGCRTAIYSGFVDDTMRVLAAVAGADVVVSKSSEPDEVVEAVRDLAAGKVVPRTISPAAMTTVSEAIDPEDLPILAMLMHDTPPGEIAETLDISDRWLRARRWAILRRLSPRRTLTRR